MDTTTYFARARAGQALADARATTRRLRGSKDARNAAPQSLRIRVLPVVFLNLSAKTLRCVHPISDTTTVDQQLAPEKRQHLRSATTQHRPYIGFASATAQSRADQLHARSRRAPKPDRLHTLLSLNRAWRTQHRDCAVGPDA